MKFEVECIENGSLTTIGEHLVGSCLNARTLQHDYIQCPRSAVVDEKVEFQGTLPPQHDVREDRRGSDIQNRTGHKDKAKDLIMLLGLTSILLQHHSKQQILQH